MTKTPLRCDQIICEVTRMERGPRIIEVRVPVGVDHDDIPGDWPWFTGHGVLVDHHGARGTPHPMVQFPIEAATIEEAFEKFDELHTAAQKTMKAKIIQNAMKPQLELP